MNNHHLKRFLKLDPTITFDIISKIKPEKIESKLDNALRIVSFYSANRNPHKYETHLQGKILKMEIRTNTQNSFKPIAILDFDTDAHIIKVTIRLHRAVQFMMRTSSVIGVLSVISILFSANDLISISFAAFPLGIIGFSIIGIQMSFMPLAKEIKRDIFAAFNQILPELDR